SELDIAGGYQVRGNNDRFRVSRNGHPAVDLEGHLGLCPLRLNGLDIADLDTRDSHFVTRVDRGGGGEIGGNRPWAQGRIADETGSARNDEPDQDNRRHGRQALAQDPGAHWEPPILPPNVQLGHTGIPLYGQGISDRGTGEG